MGAVKAELKHRGSQEVVGFITKTGAAAEPPCPVSAGPPCPVPAGLGWAGAALTGVAGGHALLCPVTPRSEGQRPRLRVRGVGSGVHIPLQNQPAGLQLQRGKACHKIQDLTPEGSSPASAVSDAL